MGEGTPEKRAKALWGLYPSFATLKEAGKVWDRIKPLKAIELRC
jgi:hypothetical protein